MFKLMNKGQNNWINNISEISEKNECDCKKIFLKAKYGAKMLINKNKKMFFSLQINLTLAMGQQRGIKLTRIKILEKT